MTNVLSGEVSTGEMLDRRYRLQERIGEGGMARVYRAEDTHLRRSVAVKVFREPTDGIASVERALSETTLLASLSHHALVTVFDARIGGGETSYLVMEHVEGITLRDLVARGPVTPAVVASIAIDIAEGLHVAHERGIIHRDIKPSNVLLWESPRPGWEWRAKLADFGIAYLMDSTHVTAPGVIVGTVAYVAPEQARGAPPAPPADIYAFGLLLIEALTGKRPFGDAEGVGTIVARLSAAPEIPDSLHPAWQGLLRGMTAIRPDDRPTALEVVATASRLAAMENSVARRDADPTTAPIAPPIAPPIAESPPSLRPPTGPTEAMPQTPDASVGRAELRRRRAAEATSAAARSVAVTDAADSASPSVPAARRRPSRRALVVGALIAGLLALGVAVATLLLSGAPTGGVQPTPTTPVVEQQDPAPSEEAPADDAPAVDEAPPAEDPPVQPPTDPRDTDTSGNSGNGSGNGNGNGNGNSGPGNNNGNGNGNGNSGPGNNNGNGNG